MAEHVILFGGPMGAGKTTAIQTLSEVDVVLTEAANNDREYNAKPTTTVALDYGEITFGDEKMRLYGIPGQRRFDFMWRILSERAHGMVLLIDNDGPDPVTQMLEFIEEFRDVHLRGGIVVGVSRTDISEWPHISKYAEALAAIHPDLMVPIFTVDPRDSEHMQTLLMTLVVNVEMRLAFAANEELETA